MKVSLYKRIEKSFKAFYLKPLTLLRYGTLRPRRAKLHGSPHWIYIDPQDPCAIKKVVQEPLRGKVSDNLVFWREFNRHLKPGLLVDVGLNYGECTFGADYAPESVLHGFEANPRLIPHLEESRKHHPDGERIHIHNCLVSDTPADDVPFLVNPDWSGSSSAVRQLNDRPESLEFKLPARTIDSFIAAEQAKAQTLLFKMDIEGYEARALRGFAGTLEKADRPVGFIEFNSLYLGWAGEDPGDYLGWLHERFEVFRIANLRRRQLVEVKRFEDIPKLHGDPNRVHTDLVLVGKQAPEGWLPPEWKILTA